MADKEAIGGTAVRRSRVAAPSRRAPGPARAKIGGWFRELFRSRADVDRDIVAGRRPATPSQIIAAEIRLSGGKRRRVTEARSDG